MTHKFKFKVFEVLRPPQPFASYLPHRLPVPSKHPQTLSNMPHGLPGPVLDLFRAWGAVRVAVLMLLGPDQEPLGLKSLLKPTRLSGLPAQCSHHSINPGLVCDSPGILLVADELSLGPPFTFATALV